MWFIALHLRVTSYSFSMGLHSRRNSIKLFTNIPFVLEDRFVITVWLLYHFSARLPVTFLTSGVFAPHFLPQAFHYSHQFLGQFSKCGGFLSLLALTISRMLSPKEYQT